MITFHTNLDEPKHIVAGLGRTWMGQVPSVGSLINFKTPFPFSLVVCSIEYDEIGNATVELHLGSASGFNTIVDFMDWWKRMEHEEHCKNVVSSFENHISFEAYVERNLGYRPHWLKEVWRNRTTT